LVLALQDRRAVAVARRLDSCLVCRREGVNEAGLCHACTALIEDPAEQRLVTRWLAGEGP